MTDRTCSIAGCESGPFGHGWCNAHYKRWRKYGDPLSSADPRYRCRYVVDEHYFDAVDAPEKAYWLGFIAADGCIRSSGSRKQLVIRLKDSDVGHLEKLRDALGANYPIALAGRRGIGGPTAGISVSSGRLVASLMILGIEPRKSLIVQPWNGPADLMPHYWRGLVDGDGCIGKSAGREKWALTLCGSEACVAGFAEWARPICRATSRLRQQANTWYWTVAGFSAPQALVTALYQDAPVYLDRKYALAQELMAKTPRRDRFSRAEYCIAPGCGERASCRDMCKLHYRYRWVAEGPNCMVDGCTRQRFARDRCGAHYRRLLRSERENRRA